MSEMCLDRGWLLGRAPAGEAQGWEALERRFGPGEPVRELPSFPMQVHDALLEAGEIENPNVRGINEDLWIHDMDWIYRCDFPGREGENALLCLDGADTFADVWLNGTLVGRCEDVYLSWRFDVSGLLRERNRLMVHFHASRPLVEAWDPGEKYRGAVPAISALRVFRTGYHDYCGPNPCLIRCGLYAPVRLLTADPAAVKDASVAVAYDPAERAGSLRAELEWLGDVSGLRGSLCLYDPAGREAARAEFDLAARQEIALRADAPQLWHPWTHGEPACYRLELRGAGTVRSWSVGFRTVEVGEDLAFTVNGKPFRPWGANLMHLDTLTNCYDPEKMGRMLDLAVLAGCNMLRIWGEADRLPQEFYDECDRRGILLWQDFFLGCSLYPEDDAYAALVAREGEQLVRACRHHPSIALWCGGNELYLARDYQHPEAPVFGEALVTETLKEVCQRLDPGRYYRPNSPMGGRWANDPAGGDTHGYTHLWFVPGREHPVFLSENCRVSPPTLRSLRRMMPPEELWPEGYRGGLTRSNPWEWPETWNRHAPSEGWKKLGPVERYWDAETVEELVYRLGMAHAEYVREQVSRFRRGRAEPEGERRTNGHLLWRLNDNSNVISFGVVDYFLEPGPAFYELRRCYQPLFVSCQLGDSARIWFVNDTPEDFQGRLEVSLFHLAENRVTAEKSLDFSMAADASGALCDLDDFGQFRKENVVCMRVLDSAGREVCRAVQPCDMERRLPYPEESGLTVRSVPGGVELACLRFAHAVELSGEDFGWVFEDNFFDLLPGEKRVVPVLRRGGGRVTARAAYDRKAAEIEDFRTIDVNGVRLHYAQAGEGKPVILIHGNGESHEIFALETRQLVEAGYRVYALDSRGHGANEPLAELHYADIAEDVYQFIRAMHLEKPAYYGFSDGGIVGLMLAMAHPEALGLMAISGANLVPEGLTEEIQTWIREEHARNPSPLLTLMLTEPHIDPAELAAIKIPVLVTAGSRDMIRPEETRRIAEGLPEAELVILEGEGHETYIIGSETMGRLLLGFLRKHGY